MHGVGGEDGTAQELLEILGIPFTGPAAAACARCIDKVLAKATMEAAGIPTPDSFSFTQTAFRDLGAADALGELEGDARLPARGQAEPRRLLARRQVRLVGGGGSRRTRRRLLLRRPRRARALRRGTRAGGQRARHRGAADRRGDPRAEGDRYDFEARYEIGRTRFVCPAALSPTDAAAVTEAALATCRALGCEGFARVDLILGDDGPWVLEANAIPGLTDTSLLPQAAEAAGMSFEDLVTKILDLALTTSPA